MKLQATFPKRRDGSYGRVTNKDALLARDHTVYEINQDGSVDVPDEFGVVLLRTGNFVEVGGGLKNTGMIITNGDQTINLMTLGKAELLSLANDVMGLGLHHKSGETKLRDAISEFANKAGE